MLIDCNELHPENVFSILTNVDNVKLVKSIPIIYCELLSQFFFEKKLAKEVAL